MARFKRETILREDSTGAIIAGATVTVYLGETTDLATIYSTKTSPTPITGSQVTTDSKGKYVYYVTDTDYTAYQLFKETITKTGYTTVTYDDIDIIETVFDHLDVDNNITVGGTVDGRDISADLDQAVKTTSGPTFDHIHLTSGQVGFPATQVPSADANTLDDYEEGTWTPVLSFGGASVGITYSCQIGNYLKIGSAVFFECYIVLTSKGSSTGTAAIASLPFVSGSAVSRMVTCQGDNLSVLAQTYLAQSSQTFLLFDLATSPAQLTNTNFANNTNLRIVGFYRI